MMQYFEPHVETHSVFATMLKNLELTHVKLEVTEAFGFTRVPLALFFCDELFRIFHLLFNFSKLLAVGGTMITRDGHA